VGGGGRNFNQGGTLSEFIAFATKNWLTPCFHAVNTDISHCSHGRAIIPIVPPFRLLLSAIAVLDRDRELFTWNQRGRWAPGAF
jgi:hypothetical protein